jgi:MoaA/NifB/PqqE/SkfB family radical SAM enzyme
MAKRWLVPTLDVRPVVAELFLTENCNLRCVSCACWRTRAENELSREEWFDVIGQLAEMRFVKLNFTGGEVLLRRDLGDIVRFASENSDATLHLNTNAILLTRSKTRELIDAGVRSFNVSFDGATAAMHDDIRGLVGAFDRTLENFQELLRLRETYGLKLRMCFTVMRKNTAQLVDMAKLAQKHKVQLFLNVLTDRTFLFRGYEIGGLGDMNDVSLSDALDTLLAHKRQHPEFLPRYSAISYVGDHFKDQLQPELPCVEANLKFMVHSRGEVGGCWAHDPEFSVRKQRLAQIIRSERFRKTQTDLFFKRCKGCGSNHSLNLRFDPRAVCHDALWKMGIITKKRSLFA